ncbi:MAG: MarR family transcriptional regulator [Nocardioides sp.]|uniref:MarR family winged helix-turn-helix transcriptional regulator n=1 Tax=Nocardioides sp. TaxID=35761 RepID=UPI00262F697A|nr:MarR family transcriptional regulator [Nocardioides sp.]MCW2833572.1 MarR family transcriptional regulator [Nocardioides sp.]
MSPTRRERQILGLEHELAVLVRRLKRVISERARTVHEELTPAGYLILTYVVEKGSVRPSEVGNAFDLDKGAVSRQIQLLVDLGLATKERDPDDGRAWVVRPTDAALERTSAMAAARRARLGQRLEDWADEDLEGFVATLARYNTTLE